MTARFLTALARALSPRAALCVAFAAPGLASAAGLNIDVTDAAGKPLIDAVALLEPVNGRAPVKPLADAEISQAKRQFSPRVTVITTGTRATFPNFDTVRHHVYSFSAAKTFELKLYAGVPNLPITFDKPGIVVLGCNIHDTMAAWVVVADTPWFARTAQNGHARIESAPAGNYKLRLWHPSLPLNGELAAIPVALGASDVEIKSQLAVSAEP
ncbi:MAG TPA: methylamine utilization protein [Burkholderiaceae bacterium]